VTPNGVKKHVRVLVVPATHDNDGGSSTKPTTRCPSPFGEASTTSAVAASSSSRARDPSLVVVIVGKKKARFRSARSVTEGRYTAHAVSGRELHLDDI